MTTPTTRRLKGRTRQQQVIDAAAAVIAERGIDQVRISDVAQRAGMTPGHVTYYFPTKTELLINAIRQSEASFIDDLERQIGLIEDPWLQLERYFELAAATGPGDVGWVLWLEVWSLAANDAAVASVHEDLDLRARNILANVLRHGIDAGVFRCDDPDNTARVIAAVVDGLSIQLTLGVAGMERSQVLTLCDAVARAQLGA